MITNEKDLKLIKTYQADPDSPAGIAARDELTLLYEPYLATIVKNTAGVDNNIRTDLTQDLLVLFLDTLVRKFNPDSRTKFKTYVIASCKKYILTLIRAYSAIKIPNCTYWEVVNAFDALKEKRGIVPNAAEISDYIKTHSGRIVKPQGIRNILVMQRIVSLDAFEESDAKKTLYSTTPANNGFESQVDDEICGYVYPQNEKAMARFHTLPPHQKSRLALNKIEDMTCDEIGADLGITRHAVAQTIRKAAAIVRGDRPLEEQSTPDKGLIKTYQDDPDSPDGIAARDHLVRRYKPYIAKIVNASGVAEDLRADLVRDFIDFLLDVIKIFTPDSKETFKAYVTASCKRYIAAKKEVSDTRGRAPVEADAQRPLIPRRKSLLTLKAYGQNYKENTK